jgi:hypothetical protein
MSFKTTTNSSPPYRATISVARFALMRMACATGTAFVPPLCAVIVVIGFEIVYVDHDHRHVPAVADGSAQMSSILLSIPRR